MNQQNKAALRRQMKAQRAAVPLGRRSAQSAAIAGQLFALPVFQAARTVFCYCSAGDEIDTYPILRTALACGKRLCLPRTLEQGRMQALQVDTLDRLERTARGILEPAPDSPLVPPGQIDLSILPCLAADRQGVRLGYGGGYYDRFLPDCSGVRLALCADARLFARLPSQAHDVLCDIIVTESQVIYIHEE